MKERNNLCGYKTHSRSRETMKKVSLLVVGLNDQAILLKGLRNTRGEFLPTPLTGVEEHHLPSKLSRHWPRKTPAVS